MEENPKPRRRWFRFSLRTMLVLVTVVCTLWAYLGWAMNWIQQRSDFLAQERVFACSNSGVSLKAPLPLRILGEKGHEMIFFDVPWGPGNEPSTSERIQLAKELFPESAIRTRKVK